VLGYHDLKTRTAGSRIFVNSTSSWTGSQTLDEAHAIGAALRREIIRAYPRADVLIHKDPVGVERHPEDPRAYGVEDRGILEGPEVNPPSPRR
jgi:ferrous-iron efflux pump FieF